MKHTPDKAKFARRVEPVKLLPCPEPEAQVLTDILEGLESLKFADVSEARSRFMEVYTPLAVKQQYEVKQYWERYKKWRDGYE